MALSGTNARAYLPTTVHYSLAMDQAIKFSKEVADAIKAGKPIVALESTIISHGLPRPSNLDVALECERIVRDAGAVPATIALLDGKVLVGLERVGNFSR